jgi:GxxExxY protein
MIKRSDAFRPLSQEDEEIARGVVDSAFQVHKNLGPGLLEGIYETCFCYELGKHGLAYKRQVALPVVYEGMVFDEGLRLDVLVEDRVICELKAVNILLPVFEAQILSYMRLANRRLGFLINFDVGVIKDGIRRFIL